MSGVTIALDLSTVFASMQGIRHAAGVKATQMDGRYPRPGLVRASWSSLDGTWEFAYDDVDQGMAQRWCDSGTPHDFADRIEVPFPPESPASGIGRREIHPVVWYRRSHAEDGDLDLRGPQDRVLLHLGAVDHQCRVWVDGQLVTAHAGGQTPFTVDVTDALDRGLDQHVLVVRAEDDPADPDQPRGKQDWREHRRTSGTSARPASGSRSGSRSCPRTTSPTLAWTTDPAARCAWRRHACRGARATALELEVVCPWATRSWPSDRGRCGTGSSSRPGACCPAQRPGPRPAAVVARSTPRSSTSRCDCASRDPPRCSTRSPATSGCGTVEVDAGAFQLNGQPYYLRCGPQPGLPPRDPSRRARHRRATHARWRPSRRWGSTPSASTRSPRTPGGSTGPTGSGCWSGRDGCAYAFSSSAVARFVAEWLAVVRRDRSPPLRVTWVPVNESWGVPDIADDAAQRSYTQALASSLARSTRAGRWSPTRAGSTSTATSSGCTTTRSTPTTSGRATRRRSRCGGWSSTGGPRTVGARSSVRASSVPSRRARHR